MDVADGPILQAGNALWMGLALIIVAWTGMRTALSGDGWSAWEIIKLIILLSIPRGMLQFYDTPFPGIGLSFPEIIVQQGSWLNGIIVDDTGSRVWEWLRDYLSSTWLTFSQQEIGFGSLFSVHAAAGKLVVLAVLAFSSLLTLIVVLIGYSFILFAQIAIAILTLFGPLFIPWMIFGPLSFLFWSWFRMMITYSLYAAVSAAIFRIMMQLIMTVGGPLPGQLQPRSGHCRPGQPHRRSYRAVRFRRLVHQLCPGAAHHLARYFQNPRDRRRSGQRSRRRRRHRRDSHCGRRSRQGRRRCQQDRRQGHRRLTRHERKERP